MKFSSVSTATVLFAISISSMASDISLLTIEEKRNLENIVNSYDYNKEYADINNEMRAYSLRMWEYKNKKLEYNQLTSYLKNKIDLIDTEINQDESIDKFVVSLKKKESISKELRQYDDIDSELKKIESKYKKIENEKKRDK